MNDTAKKLKNIIFAHADEAQKENPIMFAFGYGKALADIADVLFDMKEDGKEIDNLQLIRLLKNLNDKSREEIEKLELK